VNQNSRAAVRSNPDSNQHEITLQAGSADVRRGGEEIQIAPYEKVSFEKGGAATKTKVLAPPDLLTPLNLQPLIVDNPRQYPIRFEWKGVAEAVEYHLRIATSSAFGTVLAEKRTAATNASVSGLAAGEYFWVVTARDAKRQDSTPSEVHKFTLAEKGKGQDMLLEVEKTTVHGTVVEILGRTEPGAALIINGQSVPRIAADGRFQYFTPPLARGAHTIKVTGQNRRGGTAQKDVQIFIQ
jgi:hypothetical protein